MIGFIIAKIPYFPMSILTKKVFEHGKKNKSAKEPLAKSSTEKLINIIITSANDFLFTVSINNKINQLETTRLRKIRAN